jgi:hypothetical protein
VRARANRDGRNAEPDLDPARRPPARLNHGPFDPMRRGNRGGDRFLPTFPDDRQAWWARRRRAYRANDRAPRAYGVSVLPLGAVAEVEVADSPAQPRPPGADAGQGGLA